MSHPIAMFDVTSPDPARSLAFYTSMFGWTPGPEFDGYTLVDAGDGIGGGIGPSYGDGDTGVKIYVRVDDLEESLADAERLGGRRLVPPTDLPAGYGSFAVIADPDGFQVGLWAGMNDSDGFSDARMHELLARSATYTTCILRRGPHYDGEDGAALVWEHGRHNCELRERGTLAITLILPDSPDVVGVGVYTCGADEADALLRDDPAIVAGALTYELQTARSFPGDALP